MDFSVFFEHAITIYGPVSSARDSGAGTALSWPTIRTANVPCLIKADASPEAERFGQMQLLDEITIATYDTSVQRGDKVVVTAGPSLVGNAYRVSSIKSQPTVDFLGIDTIQYVVGNRMA